MRDFLRCSALGASLLFASIAPALTFAQPARTMLFRQRVRLPSPTLIEVSRTATGAELRIGRERIPFSFGETPTVSLETIAQRSGNAVVVHLRTDDKHYAAVVARRNGSAAVVWHGPLHPVGDPGERMRFQVTTDDRTGDGIADIVVSELWEHHRRCGEQTTPVASRALTATGELAAVDLRPDLTAPSTVATAVADQAAPRLGALRPQGSSWLDATGRPTLPFALTDGDIETVWAPGGAHPFATFRWAAPSVPVSSLVFVAPPAPQVLPRRLWIVGDSGERFEVVLPERSSPGQRWQIDLRRQQWQCVSITVAERYADAPLGIAEVQAYTFVDTDGPQALVARLAEDGPAGAAALEALVLLGDEAISSLQENWADRTEAERRRAVRIFARSLRNSPAARSAMLVASRDALPNVAEAATAALADAAPATREELMALLDSPTQLATAVRPLLRHAPDGVLSGLVPRLAEDGEVDLGDLRRWVREAADRSIRSQGADATARIIDEALPASPAPGVLTGLALAFAGEAEALSALAQRYAERGLRHPELDATFEARWWLLAAAPRLSDSPALVAWLRRLTGAEEWMLREGAYAALAHRGDLALLSSALEDPYPRVRSRALELMPDATGDALAFVARQSARDRWPRVRAAALGMLTRTALAEGQGELSPATLAPRLREGLRDPARQVRAASLRALGALSSGLSAEERAQNWQAAAERLNDGDEWPEVVSAGIALAESECNLAAGAALDAVLRRALVPRPWDPDIDVAALALRAALRIGAPEAESMLRRASSELAPAALRHSAALLRDAPIEACSRIE